MISNTIHRELGRSDCCDTQAVGEREGGVPENAVIRVQQRSQGESVSQIHNHRMINHNDNMMQIMDILTSTRNVDYLSDLVLLYV